MSDIAAWVRFGALLRDRRNLLGLTRLELGSRAQLSDATIKFIETARHRPSRATLLRLVALGDLLTWADVPAEPCTRQPSTPHGLLQSGVLDPLKVLQEIDQVFGGAGGYLPQSFAYADGHSAAAYLQLAEHWPADTVAALARLILTDANETQIIELGADSRKVDELAAVLAAHAGCSRIDRCVVDASLPILASVLARASGSWGVLGNVLDLPLLTPEIERATRTGSRRLWATFALADLDDTEARFFRYSLAALAAPGDLLLLDIGLADGVSVHLPERLRAWLTGFVARSCRNAHQITISARAQPGTSIAAATVEIVAAVQAKKERERVFSVHRVRRYLPDNLRALLADCGWVLSETLSYSDRALMLFRLSMKPTTS